jgi:hypothetical protein
MDECKNGPKLDFNVNDIMRFYCEFSSLILENLDYCIVSICGCSVPSRQKKVDDNDWIDKNGIHYNDVGLKL